MGKAFKFETQQLCKELANGGKKKNGVFLCTPPPP